ncbi:ATP-dependent zinc metalloprotease FtsH [Kordia sp. YSTF-M3]|uniref:ATP-dependent zinc metalloprotease FtsH n=1 Tax=Kordia aestuariivivens TaxID=2759037 RepID=A0ABR7QBG8_9FLAO|nr:ATP-dependent zinc metalloprotease FtsH [Kordia aestuariivivens]MBC8755889.1 ATP-dependent zinc metalloprotease FtsH [Kordia aestuariivivens]
MKPSNRKSPVKITPFWLYTAFLILLVLISLFNSLYRTSDISWLTFKTKMLDAHDVEKIVVKNKQTAEIYIKTDRLSDPKYQSLNTFKLSKSLEPHYSLQIGSVESFEHKMELAQENFAENELVDIQYKDSTGLVNLLPWVFPILMIILFWMILFRRTSRGGLGPSSIMNFGKSTAKLSNRDVKSQITFKDVAGLEEAKVEIMEIVDFLKHPETYTRLGAKIPKGVMLVGPPGTGKTLLAKAVAGEAQVPFFSLSGSEFVEMFVGVGASRVRDLFKQAKEKAPSIIFIDEIDAIGRARGKVNALHSNDERENTLNQLLTELDGFGTNTGVIVLSATNRADILDKALLRPGRFDRHIYLELPTKQERKAIFKVHLKPVIKGNDVDVPLLASLTPGFSGADIANMCNEAALIAARKARNEVGQKDFMEARDRIVGGLERKGKLISPKEKKIVAYHEAGHAVVSWYLENVESLVKVSIIPRGKSLGAAWYLPEEHQIITKPKFTDRICAALGGRAAEEVTFDEISSGAIDDLEKVTKQAYSMVAYYGLDKEIGPLSFYDSTGENERLLGKPYSEYLGKRIDEKVIELIASEYERAKTLLTIHKSELEKLAQLLLKQEVVDKEDLERILGKRLNNVISI